MNIIELGAIGELVGGVAVIASLVFVGVQVRSSRFQGRLSMLTALDKNWNDINAQMAQVRSGTKTFKLSSFASAKEQFNGVNMTIAAHPELGRLLMTAGASPMPLSRRCTACRRRANASPT